MPSEDMKPTRIVITGADGFVGRNLRHHLQRREGLDVQLITSGDTAASRREKLAGADLVYHLAGCNRPPHPDEFARVNRGFTEQLVEELTALGTHPPIVFSSSTQAALDNPYGVSKREAEDVLAQYAGAHGVPVYLYRLTNVFGKWSRPNYNSVVSTFCHNIAHDLPIQINDPNAQLRLIYIDDVVRHFVSHLDGVHEASGPIYCEAGPIFEITLQELADRIQGFRQSRTSLRLPDLGDRLTKYLYTTYLSYLEPDDFAYDLVERTDERGKLVELLKSEHAGQIFVSSTHPGITRGNHFHHTKVEKFCVLKGEAEIRFRQIDADDVITYRVSGDRIQVVDIPPGYTHNIQNVGDEEMVVLFWANEVFDPQQPDTYAQTV